MVPVLQDIEFPRRKYLSQENKMDSIVIPAEGATNEFNFSCISMKRAILRWLCIHHGE